MGTNGEAIDESSEEMKEDKIITNGKTVDDNSEESDSAEIEDLKETDNGDIKDTTDPKTTENIVDFQTLGLSPTSLPLKKKKKSKKKKKQNVDTKNESIDDKDDNEWVDIDDTTDDVKENDTLSSPQPVPKKKKKKSKNKKISESLTNGKVKSEYPSMTDKTKMVSEKPVSDN